MKSRRPPTWSTILYHSTTNHRSHAGSLRHWSGWSQMMFFFFFFLFLGVFTRNGHEKVTILSFAISVMQVPMCSAYFFLSFSKKRKRTRTWHRAEKTTVNVFELNNHDNICRSKLNQVPLKATEPTGEWLTPKAWLLARELWHLAEILVSMSQMPCQTSGVPYSTVQYLGGR